MIKLITPGGDKSMSTKADKIDKLLEVVTSLKEEIDTLKKEQKQTTKKKEVEKPEPRKVSHSYQDKSNIINKMTGKKWSKYISKDDLKTPKATKKNKNPNPFPVTKNVAMSFFRDEEIAGKPWISYQEQLKILGQLMSFYKYTKNQKITKYNALEKYLKTRVEAIEADKKLKPYAKEHRTMSIELVMKEINKELENL